MTRRLQDAITHIGSSKVGTIEVSVKLRMAVKLPITVHMVVGSDGHGAEGGAIARWCVGDQ